MKGFLAACAATIAIAIAALSSGIVTCGETEYKTDANGRIAFLQLSRPQYPCVPHWINRGLHGLGDSWIAWLIPLDEEYLMAAASRSTGGFTDFADLDGDDTAWREGLRVLLRSVQAEAGLSPIGRFIAQQQTIKSLEQRARARHLVTRHPDILDEPLLPPIVITGLPRTGTTLLHGLLASACNVSVEEPAASDLDGAPCRLQHLTYADTLQPAARASGSEHASAVSEVGQAVAFMHLMRPLFPHMHEMAAQLPHEELHLQVCTFRQRVPPARAWLPCACVDAG